MATNKKTIELDIDAKINAAQAETDLTKLTRQLKDLNSELNKIDETSADWNRLRDAISEVEGKIGDANDRMKTITGEPLERVNSGLSLVSEGLMNLDFDKATLGINGIADGIGKMNLSKMQEGLGKVATAFANLGKALITNPLFLLGAAIALIIVNFDKLAKAGGAIGAIFTSIGTIVKGLTSAITALTDAIGLTNSKLEEQEELEKSNWERKKKRLESEIELRKKAGLSTAAQEVQLLIKGVQDAQKEITKLDDEFENIFLFWEGNISKLYKKLLNPEEYKKDLEAFKKATLDEAFFDSAPFAGDFRKRYKEALKKLEDAQFEYQNESKKSGVDFDSQLKAAKKQSDTEYLNSLNKTQANELKISADTRKNKIEDNEKTYDSLVNLASKELLIGKDQDKYNKSIQAAFNLRKKQDLAAENEYQKSKTDIILKYTLQRVKVEEKIRLDEKDSESKANDLRYKEGKLDYIQYQNAKLSIAQNTSVKQEEFITKEYDAQIAALSKTQKDRKENATTIVGLEATKLKLINDLLQAQKLLELETLKLITDYQKAEAEKRLQIEKDLQQKLWELNKKRISDLGETLQSELAVLQSHQETVTNFKLKAEKNLIDEIAFARKDANRIAMEEELAAIEANTKERQKHTIKGTVTEGVVIAQGEEAKEVVRKKYAAKSVEIEQNATDQKLAANEKMAKKAIELAQYGMDIANSLGELANLQDEKHRDEQGNLDLEFQKRIFERNKNFQYANAIMNTAAAVTGALSSSAGANWPAAIAAGIAGAVQIAKIAATKFTPEGGVGGAGGSTNITAPQMAETPKNPFFSQGYMNQNIGPNGMAGFRPGKDNNMIKVGVYESDIRSVMNKVSVLETRSTLSGAGN